ncbi:hypothetical protein NG701_17035 [Pseudarthrobacter sp. HLT3-5]|uniref:hypothetical protein n=1 Tax=Pseudarthrobacter cellobiosi TaxID=2953654 RepID=UPI00208FFA8F|nr:hypothetical protein [Pseudarthrobacter sp. HLT3-5]MCO4276108.1 hypothetical protein [Pseudarthrobacter sp. HLT3-5]
MTEQPFEQPTEQDWLGNPAESPLEAYLHNGHRITLSQAVNCLAELDHVEAAVDAAMRSPEARALWRTRVNTAFLLNIAEKEAARAEEAMQLALSVEDKARGEADKAAVALDEFARKTASA